ncbi:GntR family transcriptional regulator [Streptomyces litchfieldiae]|uniref:GntR family transcriptional regulator n=1 Tax=Streptomyces litchfieldiae TaxID=3075543 RepID=A0ABU2N0X3_9ACTN|nr:GntR family transcriptional regulator [Streptomyces sp. DSM 44938]MDT0347553.1 GntR family transcriptional regulator [Streptomyces sp. DSM 44938]
MAPNTGSAGHKYRRIAADLQAAIDRGEYGPGDRLPGENVLAERYNVAVMTARQALHLLRSQGIAESRRGAGFYVQSWRPIRRRGITRLARDQWGSGKSIWEADENRALDVDQLRIERTTAPPRIAEVLEIEPGEALTRSRRYLLDGRPVLLAVSWFDNGLVDGTPIAVPDTGPGGVYARLADLGRAPVRFNESIRAQLPTEEEAERLKMPPERAVLRIVRTAFDADGKAVEINAMVADSAAYILDYEFDA